MKTITIKVPEDIKNKVQRADIECASRRSIITTILEDNLNIPKERMEAYQKDYDEKFFIFESMKTMIEQEYVRTQVDNPLSWVLDYHTNTITVTMEE